VESLFRACSPAHHEKARRENESHKLAFTFLVHRKGAPRTTLFGPALRIQSTLATACSVCIGAFNHNKNGPFNPDETC